MVFRANRVTFTKGTNPISPLKSDVKNYLSATPEEENTDMTRKTTDLIKPTRLWAYAKYSVCQVRNGTPTANPHSGWYHLNADN